MTKHSISDVMDKFNKGDHQVVVCTSAAEEGLDFQACNVVIRYDYITSMIAMIQTRGEASLYLNKMVVVTDVLCDSLHLKLPLLTTQACVKGIPALVTRSKS